MALLLKNKQYVKFESDGTFYIYKSKSARTKNKKVTNFNVVIKKYEEIVFSLSDPVLQYYSPEDRQNFKAWKKEAREYLHNLSIYNINGHYPLMQQYIEDVDKTIPEIIFSAQYPKLAADANYSIEKIYKLAKEQELFGKIDEVKDC